MIPVPKDKLASKGDSNNRAIAISSILEKTFDSIVMKEQYASLITDDLPFGFKENSSTIISTQLLIETIEYYNSNNTDCFMLLLDASKVFDLIEYYSRNMCPVTLRLIMNMYISQKMQVRFSNVLSSQFTVGNRVKQGGVLSPILFAVSFDSLIKTLK